MNGFLHWFKASTKMKRWMFLIIVGIILACYGIAQILVTDELDPEELLKIIPVFVAGFTAIILGLVFLNKRTLELLIEATDDRMENRKNINVNSLIFNKKIYEKGPNVVVIGGGAGLNTVLSGMKNYTGNITAIATVSSYGKAPSDSRKELDTLPLDDVRNSIISLSTKRDITDKLFNYTFEKGKLKGLSFNDIYFSAMNDINGGFFNAINRSSDVLNIVGKVIPVTSDEMKICTELDNGYVIEDKDKLTEVVLGKVTKINRVFINPSNCKPAPGVIEAIKDADSIIIGPGSLYTNVIPNLLVNGVSKAIRESKAIKIYVCNIMTEIGQTDNYSVSDHINAIIDHCGDGLIDYCIYDTGEIVPEYIKMYNREGSDLVDQDINSVKSKGIIFLKRNISCIFENRIRHDASHVASAAIELICDDLKYQDKQNNPEYLMMEAKLKSDKRINKLKKAQEKAESLLSGRKDESKPVKGRKSKFNEKYSERIASIKQADEKQNRIVRKQIVEEKIYGTSKKTKQKPNKKGSKKPELTDEQKKVREEILAKLKNINNS
ncbi:Gluconeogenesis factor [compost metagenome]